jgi:hypothetical protein
MVEGVNWMHLVQDRRDQWQASVKMVMNLWFP